MSRSMSQDQFDLAVVGSGIVGLAHAALALDRGLRVVVVERHDRPVGASVRNFGHVGITAQSGEGLAYAKAGRRHWLNFGARAGFWVGELGTLVVARADDEVELLREFASQRDGEVALLDRDAVSRHASIKDPALRGGALFTEDVRVSSPEAIPALARYLSEEGVEFRFRTNVTGLDEGVVHTSRGEIRATEIVVAVGHDTDMLSPSTAEEIDLQRCSLHMLELDCPTGSHFDPVLLTGLSVLRYKGLSGCAAAQEVRSRIERTTPDLFELLVNLKMSQRPNGRLVVGDTHVYGHTHDPFRDEAIDDVLLREFRQLLGADLTVRRRWTGEYASSTQVDFLIAEPTPRVRYVSVTNGTGMTTAFGLAEHVLEAALTPAAAR
ncbi:FAD dependent oxidoreductase TIGR03364 [Rhodococcus tukisamuensis]|uniref:FAD dependent oxidoreductase TIGR03364 n=2 Tax=Rhodococcus tukisamuensis TaxID=168276 RepID=A0A1G6WFS8_9NOCA|nr:FAD dependent oxidoreductase TIGR03364 [Rhodococcus tukisamuensis]